MEIISTWNIWLPPEGKSDKTNISLGTDHRPVMMTLKQKVWKNKEAKHRPEEWINLRVLNEEETKQKFKEELGKILTGTDLDALSKDNT